MSVRQLMVVGMIVVAVGATRPAFADPVLFTNMGADSYDPMVAAFFGFDLGQEGDPDGSFSRAISFVPEVTGRLSRVEMPLQFPFSFSDGMLAVNLFAAGPDGLPGEVLETFTSTAPRDADTLSSFNSVARPVLNKGQTYFLEARTLGQADGLWFSTLDERGGSLPGVDAFHRDDGPWRATVRDIVPAFRLSGEVAPAPVPEPASMLLIGTGLALGALRRRRRAPTLR